MIQNLRIRVFAEKDAVSAIEQQRRKSRTADVEIETKVAEIIASVIDNDDDAVLYYGELFDGIRPEKLEVTPDEIDAAYADADRGLIIALERAALRIEEFHKNQIERSWITTSQDGTILGQTVRGLARVGVYIPGGTAAYPSSVLMNIIPAKLAGVSEIIIATPPFKTAKARTAILAAVKIVGGGRVFQMGGAQAIAAMAYGTRSVPRVDKITGPGNAYVAAAKAKCFGAVDIDMIAGPSEILIVADEKANARYIAADMLSQAEHDMRSSAILITTSKDLASKVCSELETKIGLLERAETAKSSLENNGLIIVCENIERACEIANDIAPEHLEILTEEPMRVFPLIKNAGSIFLGEYSPEALGDYMAGPNHVLPTGGTARFSSPLGVQSFQKKSSFIMASPKLLTDLSDDILKIASFEGLDAHAKSITARLECLRAEEKGI